ncbi:MAG: hypothetical protein ABSH47_02945 [Bryobacteraceae bacterium]|jgi:hypothetical protein
MTQALHIFRKDVQCFRHELGVIGALTIAFAWAHIAADAPGVPEFSRAVILAYLTNVLLVIGWWFLVSQIVHEEALAGDRQFWITRPYSWKQLLCAKVLFVLAFINVPLLLAQMVILGAAGFPPLAGFPKLLWMQFAATVVLLVPAFALATVTRSLARIALSVLCVILCLYFWLAGRMLSIDIFTSQWTNDAAALVVICAGAALVVRWQYSRRRTGASVFAGLCTLVLAGALYVYLPMTLRCVVQSWMFREPEARAVSVTPGEPRAITQTVAIARPVVLFGLPLTVTNVPAGEIAQPDMINLNIGAPSGVRWSSGWTGYNNLFPPAVGPTAGYWDNTLLKRDFYRRIAGATVTLRASLYVGLQSRTTFALTPGHATHLPGGGYCEISTVDKTYAIFCSSPFRSAYERVVSPNGIVYRPIGAVDQSGPEELLSRWQSPWPAEFALSPVFTDRFRCAVGSTISFVREDPRAWVRRDLKITAHLPPEPQP